MKFGGTSVGDTERLKRVARRLVAARESGSKVVGVVSAMGQQTDELLSLAHDVSASPQPRELDMLLSVGERISCALVAMAIVDLGHRAISLTGSQAGIVTDSSHTKAKIVEVRARRIHEALDRDEIVLVAGFQGVSSESLDVTTLGRGGSDTTAVALAAALGAGACEIYTDVRGVFTADPRLVPGARKLDRVSFEEMLEMASSGAGVMMARSIEIARTHTVRLNVRSSFEDDDGTWITEEDDPMLEKALISAVVHQRQETVYRTRGTTPARLFAALAEANVNVDTILQEREGRGRLLGAARGPRGSRRRARRPRRIVGSARRPRKGVGDRCRHEEPPGRGGSHVRDARAGRRQACGRLDLTDQDRLPRRGVAGRCCRAALSTRRSTLREQRRIGVVGGTGAVGTVTLDLLRARGFDHVRVFASARSAGKLVGAATVEEATPEALARGDIDLFLFSVGTTRVARARPSRGARRRDRDRQVGGVPARARTCRSSCPEVNGGRALENNGIVANPNCCAIPLTCVLKPLHDAAGLVRVRVATYQSVSGAGAQAMERLRTEPQAEHDLRMDWSFDGEEFDEEVKLREETRKILELPELPVQATCVRVPVMVGHAEAVWVELEDELSTDQARELLGAAPSVQRRGRPVARQGARHRRRARRAHPPRPDGRARPRALPRVRQPPQGRGAERDPDRRARCSIASAQRPEAEARCLAPGCRGDLTFAYGRGAGTGSGTPKASFTTRSTFSLVPSATGWRPPSSSRESDTRPAARSARNPKSARKSCGNTVRCTRKRS